jgi:hypothetical protein
VVDIVSVVEYYGFHVLAAFVVNIIDLWKKNRKRKYIADK